MTEPDFKKFSEAILKVFDGDGNEIKFSKKEIRSYKPKYSSVGHESPTLFLDDEPILNNKKNKRRVLYKCDCGAEHNILLCKYLVKNGMGCDKCRENDEKIAWHKKYFEMKRNGEERGNKVRVVSNRKDCFENEDDLFKEDYFRRNLTYEEFDTAKRYIYSISGINVYDKDLTLLIAEKAPNAKLYSQKVSFDGTVLPLKDISLRCPICGEVFHITRQLKERVDAHNFDCRKCFLNNKTFAVKKYMGTYLTYQGMPEFNFIKECLTRKIAIENGPKIRYVFNDSEHIYTADFFLPEMKMVIEIKDNHIWHRKQVESGKWAAKEFAAMEYCEENGLIYRLLFTKDIDNFFNEITK